MMQAPITPTDLKFVGSPSFESSAMSSPTSQEPAKQRAPIDFSKFKTKLCRNYIMGIHCPFNDKCVFAHGESQIRSTNASPAVEMCGGTLPPYAALVPYTMESPECSRPATPPQYPTRFRYEPYSQYGIVFA